MENNLGQRALPEVRRAGLLIRDTRKSLGVPIPKLAKKVNISASEWRDLESGTLKVSFSTLTSIFDLLHIPLQTVFNTKEDDFFPFVRLAMGKDPADLTDEEVDEIYDLYLNLLEFRRERAKGSAGWDSNS